MTLDSSVVIAILFAEPGYLDLVDRILHADTVRIGAPTLVETGIVFAARRKAKDTHEVEDLVHELGVSVVSFGETEWRAAATAFVTYGRGRHKAGLNFGDCLAYATAHVTRDSLLFVGNDFRLTGVRAAENT
jgi:ribonuclease VapC